MTSSGSVVDDMPRSFNGRLLIRKHLRVHQLRPPEAGDHSNPGANCLLAARDVSRCLYTSGEILLNQATSLPLFWHGLVIMWVIHTYVHRSLANNESIHPPNFCLKARGM